MIPGLGRILLRYPGLSDVGEHNAVRRILHAGHASLEVHLRGVVGFGGGVGAGAGDNGADAESCSRQSDDDGAK